MLYLQVKQFIQKTKSLILATAILTGAALFIQPAAPAQAHCDSVNGPVVKAAQQALNTGNVNIILPYIQPDDEAELTAAFNHTREVRQLGGEAKELADRFFFETAVRLHRAGEGASYTGLKDTTDHGPALTAAETALETGSLEEVFLVLDEAIRHGVANKYAAVEATRVEAAEKGTVAANRERVEAELIFEKYVYELHTAATSNTVHPEGAVQNESGTVHSH